MKRFQFVAMIALALVAGLAYAVDPVATTAALPGIFDPTVVGSLGVGLAAIGATNFIQPGDVLTLAAPYDVDSGDGAKIGNIFGVALGDAASGADCEFKVNGVWDILAVTADTFSVGASVYWDNNAKKCTSTSSGNELIGVATVAKTNGETTVRVRLNGFLI